MGRITTGVGTVRTLFPVVVVEGTGVKRKRV